MTGGTRLAPVACLGLLAATAASQTQDDLKITMTDGTIHRNPLSRQRGTSMKKLTYLLIGVVLGLFSTAPALGADAKTAPKARTLFTNVNVFDAYSRESLQQKFLGDPVR